MGAWSMLLQLLAVTLCAVVAASASSANGNRISKTFAGVTTKYLVDTQNPTGYAQVVYETAGGPDDPIPNPANSRELSNELFTHPQIRTTRRVPQVRSVNLGLAFMGAGLDCFR